MLKGFWTDNQSFYSKSNVLRAWVVFCQLLPRHVRQLISSLGARNTPWDLCAVHVAPQAMNTLEWCPKHCYMDLRISDAINYIIVIMLYIWNLPILQRPNDLIMENKLF